MSPNNVILSKYLDYGTSNPIVNRFTLQFIDIVETGLVFGNDNNSKDRFVNSLFPLMEELLKVSESMKKYISILQDTDDFLERNEKEMLRTNDVRFDDPTYELQNQFETVLIRAILAIRKFVKVLSIVEMSDFHSHKDMNRHLIRRFENIVSIRTYIENVGLFIKEVYDIRGKVEHDGLQITRYNVSIVNNELIATHPMLSELNTSACLYIQRVYLVLFKYFEFVIAVSLKGRLSLGNLVMLEKLDKHGYRWVIKFS